MQLSDMLEVGDHTFFVADVVAVYGDDSKKQLFAYDGYDVSAPLSKADKSNCAFCTEHSGAPCIFLQKTCWAPYKRF